jgi:hypothetical protein
MLEYQREMEIVEYEEADGTWLVHRSMFNM